MKSASPSPAGRVVVVGSLNVDRILRVAELPQPGETVFATGSQQEFGGKGANQAIAAARYGAVVTLVGAVGTDADGLAYREHLHRENVATEWLLSVAGVPTGSAFIAVNTSGENEIIVDRGANGRLEPAHITAAMAAVLPTTDLVLVGLECPLTAAVTALRAAAASGVRSIFNPSPVVADFPWGEVPIDTVVVNERECAAIFGSADLEAAARKRVSHLIVTRGAAPTLWVSSAGVQWVPAFPVKPLDTVGAGDTFAGVLAAVLAEGGAWVDALRHANVAAALSTLKSGAQGAMPRRDQVKAALIS